MSRTEDYLDELLHSVSMEGKKEESGSSSKKPTAEEDFLSAFESEILSGEDSDDFLQAFERELNLDSSGLSGSKQPERESASMHSVQDTDEVNTMGGMGLMGSMRDTDEVDTMGGSPMGFMGDVDEVDTMGGMGPMGSMRDTDEVDTMGSMEAFSSMNAAGEMDSLEEPGMSGGSSDSLFNLDEILNNAKEKMQDTGSPEGFSTNDGMMIDTMGGFSEDGFGSTGGFGENSSDGDGTSPFSELNDREPLSDMMELPDEFALDEFDVDPMLENQTETSEEDGKKKTKKEKKRKKDADSEDGKQEGFLSKLSRVLFGEEEEEPGEGEKAASGETDAMSLSASAENLDILKELQGSSDTPTAEPEKKEKKKKKKEKKEKKPKEKKPKAEKPKKEKKPKPPKEPDLTPPLPRVPVALIFVMTASFLLLVVMGTNLIGYSTPVSEAKNYYALGEYTKAYQALSGLKIKESDQFLYEKYNLMANAQSEYSAYQNFMEAGIYDMALDSLVRAIGRCEKYREDAENYDCLDELEKLEAKAVSALSSFGITEESARELYQCEDKETYTIEIHNILLIAGLVTEE